MAFTDAQIRNHLDAMAAAGASDAALRAEMVKYGVSPERVAQAYGVGAPEIQARYDAAITPQAITTRLDAMADAGASDAQLRAEMDRYGVTPAQVAAAYGVPANTFQARYEAAGTPTTTTTTTTTPTTQTTVGSPEDIARFRAATREQQDAVLRQFLAGKTEADRPEIARLMDLYEVGPDRIAGILGVDTSAVQTIYNQNRPQGLFYVPPPTVPAGAASPAPTDTNVGQFVPRSTNVDVASPLAARTPYAEPTQITPYAGPSLLSLPTKRPTLDRFFQTMGGVRTGTAGTYDAPELVSEGFTPAAISYVTPRNIASGTGSGLGAITPGGTTGAGATTQPTYSTDPLVNAWRSFQAGTGSLADVQAVVNRRGLTQEAAASQYGLSPQDLTNISNLGITFAGPAAGVGAGAGIGTQGGIEAGMGAAAGNFGSNVSFSDAIADAAATAKGFIGSLFGGGSFQGSQMGPAATPEGWAFGYSGDVGPGAASGIGTGDGGNVGFGGGYGGMAEGGEVNPMRAFTPRELGSTFEAPDYSDLFAFRRDVVFNPALQAAEERERARQLAETGRGGDSMLVHMSPDEVRGLQALAKSQGTSLTINPYTGMPEAFSLRKLLKGVAKVGQFVLPFIPGIGLPAKVALSAVAGGLSGEKKGFDFKRGLMSGMMAFGAGKIGEGLSAAGKAAASYTPEMAMSGMPESIYAGAPASQGIVSQPMSNLMGGAKALLGGDPTVTAAFNQGASANILGKQFSPTQTAGMGLMGLSGVQAADEKAKFDIENAARQGEEEDRRRRYAQLFSTTLGAVPYAAGGDVMQMEAGGTTGPTHTPRMVTGTGDGMSDNVPATIEGVQEARLADGEFVIPADVVADIGNGSSSAGSRKLYEMMDRIRQARHGTTRQPPEVNAEQMMPA